MKDVAVIIESSTQYGRSLLGGIAEFAGLHDWRLHFEQRGLRSAEPEWLINWKGDGIITHCADQSRSKKRTDIPVLDLHTEYITSTRKGGIIDSDHIAVGRIAAEYYLQKGYHNFAFMGYNDQLFSEIRLEGFHTALAQAGYSCPVLQIPERPVKSHRKHLNEARDFLQQLAPPCAILCASDELAIQVSNLCLEIGKSIPEQIAILGVDNDPLLCSMASPSLSSIEPDMHRMGWSVASWMNALMNGQDPKQMAITQVIPPLGVVSRQSTSIIAMEDPLVAKAMEEIRRNACQGATVEEVARTCHVSRRTLERKFAEKLKRTVKSLLSETQINRAKQLLTHTEYTLAHIAELIGMQQPEQLSHAFKRETGITPGQFRKQQKG